MGALVPYGRVWCPGADMCTKLTTSKNLQFGNFRLPADSYSLWMLPTAGDWTLIFSKEADVFHTNYDPDEDFGRIKLEKRQLPEPVEQLTFEIVKNPSGSGGAIRMRWETTEVSAPFVVAP